MLRCIASVLLALACASAAAREPFEAGEGPFNPNALRFGMRASEADCARLAQAVWARGPDGGECIRYWAAGLSAGGPTPRALAYFHGDQLVGDVPERSYPTRTPAQLQANAQNMHQVLGVPVFLVARPGVFGSSGEHKQRRREAESRILNAALDALAAKHGVREWSLVGLSGGGHVVASLLGHRSDIVCAVPASAVSSPRMRWQRLGQPRDLTGYADSWEPVDHLTAERFHPQLRVFVLGDPRDGTVAWPTQLPLAEKLKSLGAKVEVVTGEGTGPTFHDLGGSGRVLGAMCLQDRTTPEILERAARGLRG
jgi:pimeloyl-ACP methyl ester carboxylesterase